MTQLFDLHCDTPYAMYVKKQPLTENTCHISEKKIRGFSKYGQIMAIWSPASLDDETAFSRFLSAYEDLQEKIKQTSSFRMVKNREEMLAANKAERHPVFLAVEDARIVNSCMDRLSLLYEKGVRFLTLVWRGDSCIGGAYDTDNGFTSFGRALLTKCFSLGIIPDVSHASSRMLKEGLAVAEAYRKPLIATHSNSFSICPHKRNLRDEDFVKLIELGGIVGISLCPEHLMRFPKLDDPIEAIAAHLEHYLSLGGENALCLGCDLDGTDLPPGFESVKDLLSLAERLARLNYSEALLQKIFFKNAETFILKNL